MLVKIATEIAGSLSNPSKMPGSAYSLPASECKMGSKLAQIPGTTCFNCYALKGRYIWSNVKKATSKRLSSLNDPQWVEAMVTQIAATGDSYFRWHDSGDIQSVEHLIKIVEVCGQLPKVKFWMPTREYLMVQEFMKTHKIPSNLVIRLSAHKINSAPPSGFGLPTSTVHSKGSEVYGVECKAYTRENFCGKCRKCWDGEVSNVSYKQH